MPPEELYAFFKVERKYFRSAKFNFPNNPAQQKPFTIDFVSKIVAYCGIKPTTFLLTRDEFENWENNFPEEKDPKHYYLRASDLKGWNNQHDNRKVIDLDYSPGDERERDEFATRYREAITPFITKTTDIFYVSEFLGKGSFLEPGVIMDAYQKAHEDIFLEIEKQLEANKDFKYTRILRLPASRFYNRSLPSEKIVEAIKYCSIPTFQHIYRCLQKYEQQVSFIVAPVTHLLSFGLLQGSTKVILSEQYKYIHDEILDPNDLIVPAVLYIDECPEGEHPLNNLWDIYLKEFKKMFWRQNIRINKLNIMGVTKKAHDEVTTSSAAIMDDAELDLPSALKENICAKLDFIRDYTL
ncbi:hypothetical protein CRP01_23030 [Flavilitoribacter nigricans DSM 23189 = NBRC 102662]|uniref:Uncharacterized protein n=2 Tax=Flavilitoribacter TaxID=2762562 RepID=A0A2D0N6E8_FLAN2|nr:hypothetical protein CRP01_23030 [Flavilitoribacter nigricans DSM 23189 = NBRC 102662]